MQITIREPGSALTHFIAMLLAAFAAAPLLTKAALYASRESIIALSIFCVSMILLYGASATYHSLNLSGRPLRIFRKIDHMMIFILIAGSYTPICLTVLGGKLGYTLLAVIWGLALFGMILKACWITCPKWFPLSFILPWAGPVLPYSVHSFRYFPLLPSSGCLPVASSTPSAV